MGSPREGLLRAPSSAPLPGPSVGGSQDPPGVWESEVAPESWLVAFVLECDPGLGECQGLWDQASGETC